MVMGTVTVVLLALGALAIGVLVRAYLQGRRERARELRRATTPEERQERRWQLLEELYQLTNGSTKRRIDKAMFWGRLPWSRLELEDMGAYLIEKGLIASDPTSAGQPQLTAGRQLRLTPAGVEAVEQALTQADPVAYFTHVTIQGGGHAQVQVGSPYSSQQIINPGIESLLPEHRSDIQAFLHGYQQAMTQLVGHDRSLAAQKLAAAEAEFYSEHPNKPLLHEALSTLRSIAEGVAGNAMFFALVDLSKRFL
jgi:hypothetical protein